MPRRWAPGAGTESERGGEDRVTKARLYAQHGVKHFWLVDPAERILESFELAQDVWMQCGSHDDSAIARIKPCEQIELDVGSLPPPKAR
jgi:Uma2 family endonuclease